MTEFLPQLHPRTTWIEASIAFYKAIGFTQNPKFTGPEGTTLSIGPSHPTNPANAQHPASNINIMLLMHQFFKSFLCLWCKTKDR
jgi:predicted lactoylglutathione lyase